MQSALGPDQTFQRAVGLHQSGRLSDAVKLYRQVLAQHPKSAPALRYCGVALLDLRQNFEAMQMLLAAVAADPGNAEGHAFLANAHQMAGKMAKAEESYRKALDLDPANAQARNNLGALHLRAGRHAEAAECFRTAISNQPKYAQAHNNLSQALTGLKDTEGAIAAAEKAITLQPNFADAHNTLGSALMAADRPDDALAAFKQAVGLNPRLAGALNNMALLQVRSGDAIAAQASCDRALEVSPGDINALATKAVALTEQGKDAAQADLVDMDAFVSTRVISPAAAYADLPTFNNGLVHHIRTHPSLAYEPEGHATRKGQHTGDLLGEPKGPFADFEDAINAGVEAYIAALPDRPDHPVVRTVPKSWKLNVWAVVMEEDGHQVPHIHPSGWLSGVYYPRVPADIGTGEDDPRGWIEFGRPQDIYRATRQPPIKLFRPEEGMMILFPSYFYHRTVPTGSRELRVSIAFDILPKR